jgi:hypothetical protein
MRTQNKPPIKKKNKKKTTTWKAITEKFGRFKPTSKQNSNTWLFTVRATIQKRTIENLSKQSKNFKFKIQSPICESDWQFESENE